MSRWLMLALLLALAASAATIHRAHDAFETRKVCDRDGDWVKVERVWRKEDLLEIAGWAGKKRLQSLSIPDVEGRKMSKAEESEAGCARE
jgi:hypothetical protein